MSNSLWPHGWQHARPPCPSTTPRVYSNSCPSNWWCHPAISCLFLLPPIPPSIRVFSNESTLRMRWPKYWSFSFSISPSNEHPGLTSFRVDSLQSEGLSRVFSNTIVQKHQFFGAQLSSPLTISAAGIQCHCWHAAFVQFCWEPVHRVSSFHCSSRNGQWFP